MKIKIRKKKVMLCKKCNQKALTKKYLEDEYYCQECLHKVFDKLMKGTGKS